MDSPPNYEEMFIETQLIILFSLLLVSSLQCSPLITVDAGKVHDFPLLTRLHLWLKNRLTDKEIKCLSLVIYAIIPSSVLKTVRIGL